MVCVTIINKFFICFTEFLESCVMNNFLFQKKSSYKVICVTPLTGRYCIYLYIFIYKYIYYTPCLCLCLFSYLYLYLFLYLYLSLYLYLYGYLYGYRGGS